MYTVHVSQNKLHVCRVYGENETACRYLEKNASPVANEMTDDPVNSCIPIAGDSGRGGGGDQGGTCTYQIVVEKADSLSIAS